METGAMLLELGEVSLVDTVVAVEEIRLLT